MNVALLPQLESSNHLRYYRLIDRLDSYEQCEVRPSEAAKGDIIEVESDVRSATDTLPKGALMLVHDRTLKGIIAKVLSDIKFDTTYHILLKS